MKSLFLKIVKKNSILVLAISVLLANCTQSIKKNDIENDGIRTIDIISYISKTQKVNLSTVASNIEYCILETDTNCLMRNNYLHCIGDYFVSIEDYCYVFERKSGKFVRQIGNLGQGPDDYQDGYKVIGDKIVLYGNGYYLFYNIDGTLSHKFNIKTGRVGNIAYKEFHVGYIDNRTGNETIRIGFFDKKTGELMESIPNYRSFKLIKREFVEADYSFHKFNNNLFYKDFYDDTLYHIKDFALQPRYLFDTGGRTVPYGSQGQGGRYDITAAATGRDYDRYGKYIVIEDILEDTNFLYFTFNYNRMTYRAIYNKTVDEILIMPPVSISWMDVSRGLAALPLFGFENDLDGGLPFWPIHMISDREMMYVYKAEELLELDVSKITDEKLKKLLNSINEDSNPVVAIVTLKN